MKETLSRRFRDRFIKVAGFLFAGVLLLSVIFACRSSARKCTGEVTFGGQTFNGQADNLEDAQKFACNKYCLEADADFDAHYRIWLDSARGRAAGRPEKKESIYKDKELLDYLTKDCASHCVDNVKAGRLKGSAKCE